MRCCVTARFQLQRFVLLGLVRAELTCSGAGNEGQKKAYTCCLTHHLVARQQAELNGEAER
jgi:hypothetical protein